MSGSNADAFLQVASHHQEIFRNTLPNDILFYCDPQQKFLLGPRPAASTSDAPLSLAQNAVHIDAACYVPHLVGRDAHFSNVHTPAYVSDALRFRDAQGSNVHIDQTLRVRDHAYVTGLHASNLTAQSVSNVAAGSFCNIDAYDVQTQQLSTSRADVSDCHVDTLDCARDVSSHAVRTSELDVRDKLDVSSFIGFSRRK